MNHRLVSALLANIAQDFTDGRTTSLIGHYDYPFVLHLEDELVVYSTPQQAEAALIRLRALFHAMGHVATGYHIRAVELPRNRRFRVWAEQRHMAEDGTVNGSADVVLYLRGSAGSYCVEMQHVTRKSTPGFRATPLMARPA